MNRDPLIDNAKFYLIFLVVFGHVIQPFTSDVKAVEVLYHWIYLFHMPAFIMLSGFFAKGFLKKSYIKNLSKKLLLPYLIFHLFYTLYYLLIGVTGWQLTIFNPRWSLWFLISLFCWHLLLIVFKKLTPLQGVPVTIALGVIVGYIDPVGHTFSLSRTIVFFPFFLVGYWIKQENLEKLMTNKMKIFSFTAMFLVAVGLLFAPSFSVDWLLASKSYQSIGHPEIGGVIRLGIYLVSFLMTMCFFTWIPTKETIFTNIGQKTIYIYLLHGIFIHFFRQNDLFKISTVVDVIVLAFVSLAIVWVLSTKYVRMITQPLIEAKCTMLRRHKFLVPKGSGAEK
ncbi:acyltransferase family protein [Mesobacillus maritimus]|uniref:acyltransferase family protein n=1 Tax=Mesobacillus maritimus TaxID=1643336 RepID=UPI00384C3572